jgi:diguanylate cyclase (GGDEF)-like protein
MATLSQPTPGSSLRFTNSRLLALGTASLIAPGILAVEQLIGSSIDIWPVVGGCTVMFVLVVCRMSLSIRQIIAANRERLRLQGDLAYQASHDVLTGLSNRGQAMLDIEAALNRARRSGELLGMLFVDLDGFKAVNDSYGHRAGDEVLRSVAVRLQTLVRGGDLVARLGGDEFVILLETVSTESDVVDVAHRIVETIAEPFPLSDGHCARIGASVGVTISQDASIDPNRILHEADTAAYRAKRAGRGRVEIFDNALRLELAERADLEAALKHAIEHDELTVHYQPITALDNNSVHGYEALVRWPGADGSVMMPDSFIPTAELSDLICDLDTWVLNHATGQLAEWDRAGFPLRTIAVNVSGRHVSNSRIVRDVETALTRAGLAPSRLIVEITETVLMDDVLALDHLRRLQALGVAISIDDFGTGYNWVTRLKNLPVDIIKIDRYFLERDQDSSHALLELIIRAAHTFGLPVVAEGIEHPSQLDLVTSMACEFGQGFLLAEPLTAAEVASREAATPVPNSRLT